MRTYESWLFYALASLCFYGLWGFLGAKAARLIDPRSVIFFTSLGVLVAGMVSLFSLHFRPMCSHYGWLVALCTGLVNGLGTWCVIAALRNGPVVPVFMIPALYPVISLGLAVVFLHQVVSLKQMIGVVLAMLAIFCLL